MKVNNLKNNPNNPRVIKDDKFHKLKKSIESFPEMMEKRPIVCVTDTDGKLYPLGGNMRLKAIKELKIKEIPDSWVVLADDWTQEQRNEFVIKDNVGFGEWDFDTLANEWDLDQLDDWGLEVWQTETEDVDYSILDDEDLGEELSDMTSGVKKAIQIEFNLEDYEEAARLVKLLRDNEIYVGGAIIEALKNVEKGI